MSDRYEKIREALAMGPTPGPWEQDGDGVSAVNEDIAVAMCCPSDAEAAFIAACDPGTIWALLAERDALRKALELILENEASDWKFAEEFGGYVLDDDLREEARAALSAAERSDGRCR